jgi:hypothetical protein
MRHTDLQIPEFYRRYVLPIQDMPLFGALDYAMKQTMGIIRRLSEERGAYRYQPEKWTIKEVLCHMLDTERIMGYRALRFARNDKTALTGFDENSYAPEANAANRTLAVIAAEAVNLRNSTVDLFGGFTPEMLTRTGNANGIEFSVNALGYIIAGHSLHHCRVLVERYHVKRQ